MKNILRILTTNDILLIFFLLIISFSFAFLNFNSKKSRIVEIYYKNSLFGKYPLSKNTIITLDKDIRVEIKDNKVRMLESTCKRQLCVKQGWSDNIPIICVPNQVLIKIVNDKENKILITR